MNDSMGAPGEAPVSGWVPPAPPAPKAFRSAATRAKWAVGALAIVAALDVATLWVDVSGLSLVDSIRAGTATLEEANAWDTLNGSVAIISLVALILSVFGYLAWLSRAVENAPALGAGTPPRTPRAAIGWWFVPFASLWVPYTIVRDLHDRLGAAGDALGRPLLRAWWAFWLLSSWAGNAVGRLWLRTETLDDLGRAIGFDVATSVLDVVAAILAIAVVRRIQAREDRRADTLPGQPNTLGLVGGQGTFGGA